MAGYRDAVVCDGPNKGLTIRECETYGLVLTGNVEDDCKRAEIARQRIAALAEKTPAPENRAGEFASRPRGDAKTD